TRPSGSTSISAPSSRPETTTSFSRRSGSNGSAAGMANGIIKVNARENDRMAASGEDENVNPQITPISPIENPFLKSAASAWARDQLHDLLFSQFLAAAFLLFDLRHRAGSRGRYGSIHRRAVCIGLRHVPRADNH